MPTQNILVIEDDPAVARATERMLQKSGFRVFVAASGEQGEDILTLNADTMDTVLIDYTLPGANGIEILDRLRGRYPNLGYVLMSGLPRESLIDDADGPALSGFLQKPFMMGDLVSVIRAFSPPSVSVSS